MSSLQTITTIFLDRSGKSIPNLDVKSRYKESARENLNKTNAEGLFVFQASPNRVVEVLAKPPNTVNYTVFKVINSSVESSRTHPIKIELPQTIDEYKNNNLKNKGIVRTVFKIVDSNGKPMVNFPIQSRPKGKSNSKDIYTNEFGIVGILSSPNRDIEILALNINDEFQLKQSLNSGEGTEVPITISLDEPYENYKSSTLVKLLDRNGKHYVLPETDMELEFNGIKKNIKVKNGQYRIISWIGQEIKLTIYKPDGKPLDSVTYIARRKKEEYVDLQIDVDITNGKTLENEPNIAKRIEDPDKTNSEWDIDDLGTLSEQYETGGRGSRTVSGGTGDAGGVSYGSYQMTSKTTIKGKDGKTKIIIGGRVKEFINSSEFKWGGEFNGLTPGSSQFTAKWKEIVDREGQAFKKTEHAFIKRTHYDVTINNTIRTHNIDLRKHSKAINDVIWSTSVHNGPHNPIINKAITNMGVLYQNTKDYDKKLIEAIYKERGKTRSDGNLAYFSKNSKAVQAGVAKRFISEKAKAIKELENEK